MIALAVLPGLAAVVMFVLIYKAIADARLRRALTEDWATHEAHKRWISSIDQETLRELDALTSSVEPWAWPLPETAIAQARWSYSAYNGNAQQADDHRHQKLFDANRLAANSLGAGLDSVTLSQRIP